MCCWYEVKDIQTYEERLKLLKLTTLEKRRQRGDLVEVYKIFTGKEDIDSSCMFVPTGLTRF